MATAARGRPRRINPTGGGNEQWLRQGQDCAALLRGFEENTFRTWQEFVDAPDFHIFDRKYIRDNLRRNFETMKERWEKYHQDGSGDLTENLRELAGLPPPRLTGVPPGGGQPSAPFIPGNDGGDEDEDLLDELQEEDQEPPRPPPPAPAQVQPPQREPNFDVASVIDRLRNLEVDDDSMKGCFIQEVTDPEDPSRTRNRLGVYCVLYGGVHVDLVEVRRPNDTAVKFVGLMDTRVGSARNLLGRNLADAGTIRALQGSIDRLLRDHQSQGGNNDGSLPAEAAVSLPPSPNGLGWRPGFISPHNNLSVEDPLFFNRIPSTDPEMQSDTLAFFCFLMENKANEHAAPAHGRRDHRAQLAAAAPVPAPTPTPRVHRRRSAQPMDVDSSTTQRESVGGAARQAARSRPRNTTRASSPRRRQRIDESQSYIEESDEAFENVDDINISGSFESANEYSDDYDDDEFGNVTTIVSEE